LCQFRNNWSDKKIRDNRARVFETNLKGRITMGAYSGVLNPTHVGFWIVAGVGFFLSLLPLIVTYFWECDENKYKTSREEKKIYNKRGPLLLGLFVAFSTLLVLHLFGDKRILGWMYEVPAREHTGWGVMIAPFGPVFFMLVLAELVVGFLAVKHKQGIWATCSLVLTLLLVQLVTGVPVLPWMLSNPLKTIAFFCGYVCVGAMWSFFYKWDVFVSGHRERYDAVRHEWLTEKGLREDSDFTLEDKLSWEAYFEKNKYDDDGLIEVRPKYRQHKSQLLAWASLWFVSMFETFMFDWLSDVFGRIYGRLGVLLEWIMLRRWKGTEGHMLTEEERSLLTEEKRVPIEDPRKAAMKQMLAEEQEAK
jgi:hypothetical protein